MDSVNKRAWHRNGDGKALIAAVVCGSIFVAGIVCGLAIAGIHVVAGIL